MCRDIWGSLPRIMENQTAKNTENGMITLGDGGDLVPLGLPELLKFPRVKKLGPVP